MLQDYRPFLPIWWLTIVQVSGLAVAWLARVHQGSHRQSSYHWMFLVLLALVGATTLAAAYSTPAQSVMCGATLSAMVLTAVWDFSNGRKTLAR